MKPVSHKHCIAVALALFPVAALAASQVPPSAPVTVVNTPANPVPVTGAVTGTVQLAPGTEVVVGNTVDDPVRVRNVNDALQPVHKSAFCTTNTIGCGPSIFYQVPNGKRLVIEYASFEACLPPGQATGMRIRTTVGGELVTHHLSNAPAAAGPGTGNLACNAGPSSSAAVGQQVRIYADPGTFVGVEGTRNSNDGNVAYSFSISGYLLDVPLTP